MKYYVLIRTNNSVYVRGFKRRFLKYYIYVLINKIKGYEVEHGSI